MPRSEGQKLKLLYLKQIFEEYSDENHGLTMEQILAHLSHNGVTAERKSIYMDIAVLTDEYGMDIELDKAAKPPVYKLMSRDFELPELKMMVDSIASSKFLSEAKTRVLIDKIKKLCSHYDADSLSRQVTLANRVKSMNKTIHYNVDAPPFLPFSDFPGESASGSSSGKSEKGKKGGASEDVEKFLMTITGESLGMKYVVMARCIVEDKKVKYIEWSENEVTNEKEKAK